ncbi:hypothetical protein [Maribacter luteus]|uniref:Lipocalin-like domain-containing protein n=1 Tax=Maribacter luteus TaxID=2594478 RepID=A0A6I2MU61_9FLAO|nr:hypothetical protein [Maribacter luteus]MRX65006.1 hypothetical protein [Maribacter luteus]
MKKVYLLLMVFSILVEFANAQKSQIVGNWLVQKVEVDNKVEEPYMVADFMGDGKMVMMGVEVGTWDYNKKEHSVVMKSGFDKDFNGEGKILELNDRELIVLKDGAKVFYDKLDLNKIMEENKNSGLLGIWEFKNMPYQDTNSVMTFEEPDVFTFVQKEEYHETNINGTWIFDKKKRSVILIGFRSDAMLRGESEIMTINEAGFELRNKGKVYKAIKKVRPITIAESDMNIEQLAFSEEDFFTEDGDYKYYSEVEKLPWHDMHLLLDQLSGIKQLVYSYNKLNEESNTFDTEILKANVFVEKEQQRLKVDNIFYGFDRFSSPEDVDFPENDENGDNDLYPLNESMYRVLGQEELDLGLGTFACTVVEALNSNGEQLKIWLINDKPAVIAKLIKASDSYDHYYSVYELQEIINK